MDKQFIIQAILRNNSRLMTKNSFNNIFFLISELNTAVSSHLSPPTIPSKMSNYITSLKSAYTANFQKANKRAESPENEEGNLYKYCYAFTGCPLGSPKVNVLSL